MIFDFGELFSGPGGLSLGALQSEMIFNNEKWAVNHVWANDIDSDACATYGKNFSKDYPNLRTICCPVQELVVDDLENIQAFAFGFPCNDFSVVGEQNGIRGRFGPLYKYGVEVLKKKQPYWFFAENVSGLMSSDGGKTFNKILEELNNAGIGYRLTPNLYKFEEYGVPQKRHRIIIIGIRNDFNLKFEVPAPLLTKPEEFITVEDALEKSPIPEFIDNNEKTSQSKTVIERLKHIPPGENAWYDGIPRELRLRVKGAKLSQIYRRLKPDEPAYTITGSGGGGTHVYHWSEPRALTNRERARLQTFPDDFVFVGKKESVRKQIGMAVPPLGVKIIIQAIYKTFAHMPYDNVPSSWDLPLLNC